MQLQTVDLIHDGAVVHVAEATYWTLCGLPTALPWKRLSGALSDVTCPKCHAVLQHGIAGRYMDATPKRPRRPKQPNGGGHHG